MHISPGKLSPWKKSQPSILPDARTAGISIGFSRLFDVMRQTKRLKIGAKSPTQILILLLEETQRTAANRLALGR